MIETLYQYGKPGESIIPIKSQDWKALWQKFNKILAYDCNLSHFQLFKLGFDFA